MSADQYSTTTTSMRASNAPALNQQFQSQQAISHFIPQQKQPQVNSGNSSQSPESQAMDHDLGRKFNSFQQIDELVQKQEELYSQILSFQRSSQAARNQAHITSKTHIEESQSDLQTYQQMLQTEASNIIDSQGSQQKLDKQPLRASSSSQFNPGEAYYQQIGTTIETLRDSKRNVFCNPNQLFSMNSQNNTAETQPNEQQMHHQSSTYGSSDMGSNKQYLRYDQRPVSDRLLTMGKLYEAKKQKLREQQAEIERIQEASVQKKVVSKKGRPGTSNANNNLNHKGTYDINDGATMAVEERLIEQQKKYKLNAELKKKERLLEELGQLQEVPVINPKSEQIANYRKEGCARVEERLISIGQMWKQKKQELVQAAHQPLSRQPATLSSFKSGTHAKTSQAQLGSNEQILRSFEQRVKEQVEKKEQLMSELRKKHEQEFQQQMQRNPSLSKRSNSSSHNSNHQLSKNPSAKSFAERKRNFDEVQSEFEQRLKYYEELRQKKQEELLSQQLHRYSFKPQIDEKSRKLVGPSSTSRERKLYTPNKRNDQRNENGSSKNYFNQQQQNNGVPVYSFHPQINEYSRRLVESTTYQHDEPRWILLHERHHLRQQQEDRKKEEAMREKEEQIKQECPFRPLISDSSRQFIYNTLGGENSQQQNQLYERNLEWQMQRQAKMQDLNEQVRREEMQQCTFKPNVEQIPKEQIESVIQTDYSHLNIKSIEKYLERCNYAKQLKLEQELLEIQKLGGHPLSGRRTSNTSNNTSARGKSPSFMRRHQPSQGKATTTSNTTHSSVIITVAKKTPSKKQKANAGLPQQQKNKEQSNIIADGNHGPMLHHSSSCAQINIVEGNIVREGTATTPEEYINLEEELSLDTIKEIDSNQDHSRNNTQQNLHPSYQVMNNNFVQPHSQQLHQEEEQKEMPLYEYNSQIESVLQHNSIPHSEQASIHKVNKKKQHSKEKSFGEANTSHHQRHWSSISNPYMAHQIPSSLQKQFYYDSQLTFNNNNQNNQPENNSTLLSAQIASVGSGSNYAKHQQPMMINGSPSKEYLSAIQFLHEQLHQIDFSNEQSQQQQQKKLKQ